MSGRLNRIRIWSSASATTTMAATAIDVNVDVKVVQMSSRLATDGLQERHVLGAQLGVDRIEQVLCLAGQEHDAGRHADPHARLQARVEVGGEPVDAAPPDLIVVDDAALVELCGDRDHHAAW